MSNIDFYIEDCSSLLVDYNGLFTPRKQLIRWINEARRQVALRTGCIRVLVSGQSPYGAGAQPGSAIPGAMTPGALPGSNPNAVQSTTINSFNTITGVEKYAYAFANPYIKAANAGVKGMFDIIDLSVSWGGVRPNLKWMPWDELQAYGRSYNVGVFSYPYYWSTFNDGERGQVWLFPVPSFPGEMEWDVVCVPNDLYTNEDFEAIPEGWQNAVKFGAVALALLGQKKFLESQLMDNKFTERVGIARGAAEGGKVSDYYWNTGP